MRTGCHNLISLSVSVSVWVTFIVFTDCESCTRPISTNRGSMEAGEYGLTRGTCFLACRLVGAVAGLLWISWCVFGGADSSVLFFSIFFFFECARPAASMSPPCLINLSTSYSSRRAPGRPATGTYTRRVDIVTTLLQLYKVLLIRYLV